MCSWADCSAWYSESSFWGLSPGYREAILHPSFHPFPPVSLFLPFAFILLVGFYVQYLCTVFLQMWSCRKTHKRNANCLSSELCFLDSHLRGATMACGRSLSMGLIWTSWAMTLGAVAVSRHKVQALQDASNISEHMLNMSQFPPSSSFFPPKVLTTNSRRLSLCQLWWTLAMSPSPPGAQSAQASGHIWDTSQTEPILHIYCTCAPFLTQSRVWACLSDIVLVLRGCHGLCGRGGGDILQKNEVKTCFFVFPDFQKIFRNFLKILSSLSFVRWSPFGSRGMALCSGARRPIRHRGLHRCDWTQRTPRIHH